MSEQTTLWNESINHASRQTLDAALPGIQAAPVDAGVLEMIVRRPGKGKREVLSEGVLDPVYGLQGDNWLQRGSSGTPDRSAHPDMQINIMNSRVTAAVAQDRSRWPLAGDQLYIDMNLSESNLPPGTRLSIGTAILEISAEPHLGCRLFAERFGRDAVMFVNSDLGKQLHLRGLNARVLQGGVIKAGDTVHKIEKR
jgi:MOSC domain-containing protein YiiM